jgi:hypothetical protein
MDISFLENAKEGDHLGDLGISERIVDLLRWILKRQNVKLWTGLIWFRMWICDGSCDLRIPREAMSFLTS